MNIYINEYMYIYMNEYVVYTPIHIYFHTEKLEYEENV